MTLKLDNVRKSFGPVDVVRGLELEVSDGEFLVLLGPSGCGKTTALRMIAGLETVSDGDILIDQEKVTDLLPKYRDIAMVFQSYALYPHMTVAENIGYPLKLRKASKDEIAQAVLDVASKVHLEDYLDRFPRQLSGGQRQRVALARAMVRKPKLFLMDEPLSNLDAKLRGHMRAELKHLQAELGVTTVYVTHDQIEAMTLAHRVAIMDQGIVQQLDTPRKIYSDPANRFVAGFIGSPPMNFIAGDLTDNSFAAPDCRISDITISGDHRVSLGFRPEDAQIVLAGEGQVQARIYSLELTGDETIVTCTHQGETLVIRMGKDFEGEMNQPVGINIAQDHLYFFEQDSGERLRSA